MPNYDYVCAHCGHKEEILQKITDVPLTNCPQCKQATFKRQFGKGIGLQFQGSGFYSTDYGTKTTPPSEEKPASPPASPGCGCSKPSCGS
jgi:putative FmdB family regulatory protein